MTDERERLRRKLTVVERIISDDPEALALFRAALTAPVGKPGHGRSSTTLKPAHGTARAYTLDRLRRERPDLFERVKARKLSANAAERPTGLDQLRKAWASANAKERRTFRAEIHNES